MYHHPEGGSGDGLPFVAMLQPCDSYAGWGGITGRDTNRYIFFTFLFLFLGWVTLGVDQGVVLIMGPFLGGFLITKKYIFYPYFTLLKSNVFINYFFMEP